MTLKLDIDMTGVDQALGEIAALTPATKRAAQRAQNKTLRWARAQAASRMAKLNNVPVRAVRERVRSFPARPDKPYALLWLGVWPLPAAKVGRLSQNRSGAKAGRVSFPGAFVATMPSGHVGIFDRRGPARLPIVEQYVPLDGQAEVERGLVSEGEQRYHALLIQELNFELNVKGK